MSQTPKNPTGPVLGEDGLLDLTSTHIAPRYVNGGRIRLTIEEDREFKGLMTVLKLTETQLVARIVKRALNGKHRLI